MSQQNITTITCLTSGRNFDKRRRDIMGGGIMAIGKIKPYPDIRNEEDRGIALAGDIAFRVKGQGAREVTPQVESQLNNIPFYGSQGDDDEAVETNMMNIANSIEVIGVFPRNVNLNEFDQCALVATGGIATIYNYGRYPIKMGQYLTASVPDPRRKTAQRGVGASYPKGNEVRKLEPTPLDKSTYNLRTSTPYGVGDANTYPEIRALLKTKEFYNVWLLFTNIMEPIPDDDGVLHQKTTDQSVDAISGRVLAEGGDTYREYKEFIEALQAPGLKRIVDTIWPLVRLMVANGNLNIFAVALSDASPNQPLMVKLIQGGTGSVLSQLPGPKD